MAEAAKPVSGERRGWIEASIALLATSVFWGSAVPFTSVLLRYLDPWVIASLRMVLSVCVLSVVLALIERGSIFRLPLPWPRFFTLGFFMAGFNVFYTLGIQHSHPVTAAAITVTMPLIGSLTARVVLGTAMDRGFGVALLLSLLGGALVVHGQSGAAAGTFTLRGGEPLLLVAMLSWNIFSIKAQAWVGGMSQTRLTLVASFSTALWLCGLTALMALVGVAKLPGGFPGWEPASMLIYLAIFSAAIGNFLWNFAVSKVGLPVAALYINLSAVFAVLIGVAFAILPSWEQVAGGLLVLAGILYLQLTKFGYIGR